MPHEIEFHCPLRHGLHARPSSHFADVAVAFQSEITLINQRNRHAANAKSVLALIGADVQHVDPCAIRVAGVDEDRAFSAIREFIERTLPLCDEPLAAVHEDSARPAIPRMLERSGGRWSVGNRVVGGIGRGTVVISGGLALPPELAREVAADASAERVRVSKALTSVRAALQRELSAGSSYAETSVLKAHLSMVADISLHAKLFELVMAGATAGQAVVRTADFFSALLRAAESQYVRERAIDIQDISARLLDELYGERLAAALLTLTVPSIVVGENLSPRQFLALDRGLLRGLVLSHAGVTSHTVILARSFDIPTVVGVREAPRGFQPDGEAIVDGDLGVFVTEITPIVERYYQRELHTRQRKHAQLRPFVDARAATRDGQRLEIAANVSTAEEVGPAIAHGAEGVGLFRTEMLFMDRDTPPSEDEQFAVYAAAVRAAAGRTVIFRTLDVGGDKPISYLSLPKEPNPFLGYRGARIYPANDELLRSQLRAVLRAAELGRVWLMAPMIATVGEVQWFKTQIRIAREELAERGVSLGGELKTGVMIEIPSAAMIVDQLADEVDFFSVGTNDLAQYFLAVDRDSEAVADLYSPRHPAFLRLLSRLVADARRHGKWIGICGEMARDPLHLPLIVALGVDEISVASPDVLRLKAAIAQLSSEDSRVLLASAEQMRSVGDVTHALTAFRCTKAGRGLLDAACIVLDSASESADEVVKELVDALYVAGRTERARDVEAAIWAREATYATNLVPGFAVPHCKNDAVAVNSIAVARLTRPIRWTDAAAENAADESAMVGVVLMLAMRETDSDQTHMRVFSRLARKLMHAEFRAALQSAGDIDAVVQVLSRELEISA